MPRFSQRCVSCTWSDDIIAKPFEMPPCPDCGGATERYYPIGGKASGVIPDDWGGGRWVENLQHEPVWVESRSQLKRELDARGLVQMVRHTSLPGTDKSPHTTRWY